MLTDEFLKYITKQSLINKNDKILLAVSGGIDSVVMGSLFDACKIQFSIAHCNFGLREMESDGDEMFVNELANRYKVPFLSTKFDTINYAAENKMSIQVAARKLRYNWFSEIAQKYNFTKIALAHHADDVAETMLINLCRGTGIAGLHGILPINGIFIRPLLFAQRVDIELYANENSLKYREDSTNKKDIYARNNIRHNVIPNLQKTFSNPSIAFNHSAEIIRMQEAVYKKAINDFIEIATQKTKLGIEINIEKIISFHQPKVLLFEILSLYGFRSSQIDDIMQNITYGISGAEFISYTHKLIRDRKIMYIVELETDKIDTSYIIDSYNDVSHLPINLKFEKVTIEKSIFKNNNNNTIFVDADKIKFPLILRNWQKGDTFQPFGMKGRKKLSDYFQDIKLPNHIKDKVYILISQNEIVWIIGYRQSEKYKLSAISNNVIQISVY